MQPHASLTALLLLTGISASAAGLRIELPTETGVFKPAPDADLANAHCLACHSVEYVATQPPMNRLFWRNSVAKMQDKYGATLPADQVERLVDYLAANYGAATDPATPSPPPTVAPSSPPPTPSSTPPSPTTTSPAASTGVTLATRLGCATCHQPRTRWVGPALSQIADKYRSDPNAHDKIAQQIRHGGSGKWGPVPMPPFTSVSAADIRALTEWVLAPH